jgi:hypothetical protein
MLDRTLRRENCYHSLSMQFNRNGALANAYAKNALNALRC